MNLIKWHSNFKGISDIYTSIICIKNQENTVNHRSYSIILLINYENDKEKLYKHSLGNATYICLWYIKRKKWRKNQPKLINLCEKQPRQNNLSNCDDSENEQNKYKEEEEEEKNTLTHKKQ